MGKVISPLFSKMLIAYYAGTAVFMALDYLLGISVRLTFLDPYPGWRLVYYLGCFGCAGLMLWRPAWGAFIGAGESILTLSLIILSAATRVMIVSDEMIETGRGLLTYRELTNFGIAFFVVYLSYAQNMKALQQR